MDYVIIDGELLTGMNLRIVQRDGETPHRLANRLHHDIVNLTATNIFTLMQSITIASVTRVPRKEVEEFLQSAISDGHIEMDSLNPSLAGRLVR